MHFTCPQILHKLLFSISPGYYSRRIWNWKNTYAIFFLRRWGAGGGGGSRQGHVEVANDKGIIM